MAEGVALSRERHLRDALTGLRAAGEVQVPGLADPSLVRVDRAADALDAQRPGRVERVDRGELGVVASGPGSVLLAVRRIPGPGLPCGVDRSDHRLERG